MTLPLKKSIRLLQKINSKRNQSHRPRGGILGIVSPLKGLKAQKEFILYPNKKCVSDTIGEVISQSEIGK